MAGQNLSPRQKMINLMYLVLTALLALNVSKAILHSFVIINKAMETTNKNFEGKNEMTYNQFDKAKMNDPGKVLPFWQKAQQVKAMANELDAYIDSIKHIIIKKTSSYDEETPDSLYDLEYVDAKDNYDVPSNILIGPDAGKPREGKYTAVELRQKLEKYRDDLILMFDPKEDAATIDGLNGAIKCEEVPTSDGETESWEAGNFNHLPLAAVITNLSKMQSDVRNVESDAISALMSEISANDFKFDTLAAKVIPNTNYVILGDTYKADVIVAAFSTTQNPIMKVTSEWDSTKTEADLDSTGVSYRRGVAKWFFAPSTEGPVEWGGIVKVKKPDGTYSDYPFHTDFICAKPTLVVSPTAMNVFYRGLDNPVEVSVPGVPTEKLQVSISNASTSGSAGKYKVRPGKGKKCVVSVSADINGSKKNFGTMEFRVKNVPNPTPYFANKTGSSNVPLKDLLAAQGVSARMENFEFDLKFVVSRFKLSTTVKGGVVEKASNGPRLTSDMKKLIKSARRGQKFYVEGIKARGPDGSTRDLGAIVLKVR